MSGFTLRRFTLQNITAVAAHCPIPGVSQAALNITYGSAAVRAAVHAATASTVNNDAQAGAASPPDVEAERMLKGGSLAGRVLSFLVSTTPSGTDAGQAGGRFWLVTEEEMLWIQRRRREDAEESRVVLATRPTRNLLKGVGGGLLNVTLGCLLSPLLFITITLEKIRISSNPLVGVLVGPVYGIAWAGVFLCTALYAAAQQTVLSFYYSCVAAPTYYLINRPTLQTAKTVVHPRAWFWSPLLCRFAVVRGGVGEREPLLLCYDENDVLRERAMKRLAVRRKKDKSSATYEGKKRKPGQSVDPEDYYGLLGVDKHASEREIKVAYNKLVLKIHPDKNPAPGAAAHFDNVTKAYRVLSNPEKRKKYDLGGAKGVEDLGAKKREGVRALFGGEALVKLSGEVFMGSFSQRVIDGLDYTQEELAVLQQRMLDACRDELLENYLSHFIDWVDKQEPLQKPSSASGIGERKTGNGSAFTSSHTKTTLNSSSGSNGSARSEQSLNAWDGKMKMQLKKIVSTGLAKEVLYTIGSEYHRAIAYYDDALVKGAVTPGNDESGKRDQSSSNDGSNSHGASSIENVRVASFPTVISRRLARYVTLEGRHRAQQRLNKYKYFTKVRSDTFKSSESMIDLAWYSSVEDLEKTARAVALAVLFDPRITVAEAARRRAALAALADVFVHYGQVYKGANKQTMDQLMNSLRDYQQQREREKNM